MPIEVELPDGTIAEFPDGTSAGTMEMALAKYRAPKASFGDVRTSSSTTAGRKQQSLLSRAAENLMGKDLAQGFDSLQHNVMNPIHGAAQAAQHGWRGVVNAITPGPATEQGAQPASLTQRYRKFVNDTVAADDAALREREADYQARNPDNAITYTGAAVGQVAPFLLGGGARGLQAVGGKAASLLPKWLSSAPTRAITSGAAQGGLLGATQPITNDGDYASQKALQVGVGGLLGGAVPGVAAGGRAAWSAARPALRPQQVANEQLGRLLNADQSTLQALRSAEALIPGETPTAAQVLQNPRAVQVEKALANKPEFKTGFLEQQNTNNAARTEILRKMGGTDEELLKAVRVRGDAAKAFRSQSLPEQGSQPIDVAGVRQTLEMLAKSANAAVRSAAKEHLSILKANADPQGRVPAYALDDIRQNVGGMLAKHAPLGLVGNAETAKYAPVSTKIIRTLEREIPGYRDYLAAYRTNSAPINTMEAARRVLAPAEQRGLNSAGDERLTLAQLNTGLNKIDRSRFGVTPEAREQLEGIRRSLQRESVSNSVTSPGSDTAYNLQSQGWLASQLYGPGMEGPGGLARGLATAIGAGTGSYLGGTTGAMIGAAAGGALKAGADRINQRIAQRVAAGMRDPKEAAKMIEAYLAQHPKDAPALLAEYPQWRALLGYEAGALPQQ